MNQFRHLTESRQSLVKLMQQINFGLLRNLKVYQGQPEMGSDLLVIEDVKLDGQSGPRTEHTLNDFQLKEQVVKFFLELDRLGTGTVTEVAVRHGLPCRLFVSRQGVA